MSQYWYEQQVTSTRHDLKEFLHSNNLQNPEIFIDLLEDYVAAKITAALEDFQQRIDKSGQYNPND